MKVLAIYFLLLCSSCNPTYRQQKEAVRDHEYKLEILKAKMDSLAALSDSLWRNVNRSLEKGLAEDLAEDERRNMLQLKNAALISMFQVFDSLELSLQNQVMEAGEKDKSLASEMRKVMEQIESEEKSLSLALEELERKTGDISKEQ